jgi:hypothetical protein
METIIRKKIRGVGHVILKKKREEDDDVKVQHLKERKNWHITIFTLLMGISRVKHVEREREREIGFI